METVSIETNCQGRWRDLPNRASVGRRRAQQIMALCITDHVDANALADRDALIAHLRRLADGDDRFYERQWPPVST